MGTSPLTAPSVGVPEATGLWVPLPRWALGKTASDHVEVEEQRCHELGPTDLVLSDREAKRNLSDTP